MNEEFEAVRQSLIKEELKKAIKIIKEKEIDMYSLGRCDTVDEYNTKFAMDEYQVLTQEDFDTLKRWSEQ